MDWEYWDPLRCRVSVKGRGREPSLGDSLSQSLPTAQFLSKDHRTARSLGLAPRNLPIKGQRTPCPRELWGDLWLRTPDMF